MINKDGVKYQFKVLRIPQIELNCYIKNKNLEINKYMNNKWTNKIKKYRIALLNLMYLLIKKLMNGVLFLNMVKQVYMIDYIT